MKTLDDILALDANGLLPCPFCGGKAEMYKQYARCSNNECGVTLAATIEEWNTRHESKPVATLPALEAAYIAYCKATGINPAHNLPTVREVVRQTVEAYRAALPAQGDVDAANVPYTEGEK